MLIPLPNPPRQLFEYIKLWRVTLSEAGAGIAAEEASDMDVSRPGPSMSDQRLVYPRWSMEP